MSNPTAVESEAPGRLHRLLALLESDPDNLALIADAAETALDEGKPQAAVDLLDRYRAQAPLPPREANLAGLAAMRMQRFEQAAESFECLFESGERAPALLFNLAWSRAMLKDFTGALALLDGKVIRALPQAAMLEIQLLHDRGDLETAAERSREGVERFPDYGPLMATASVLALDMDDEALAAHLAAKAPDHPDAMTTLGTLALGQERPDEALQLFDRAIDRNPDVPRAWVGRGLAELITGRADRASEDIDRGAEMFGDHLGSWIAAGWAHFINRDLATSRARFEHALALDPNFAESQGSLAVIELIEGRMDEAKRRTEIALRLDRNCYSAALARVLITAAAGDSEQARKIFELAISSPIDGSGRTIVQALAKYGIGLS